MLWEFCEFFKDWIDFADSREEFAQSIGRYDTESQRPKSGSQIVFILNYLAQGNYMRSLASDLMLQDQSCRNKESKVTLNNKTWKPSREQIQSAHGKTIPDVVGSNLKVLSSGINPSLYSAAVGHHFARPGNRFWPTLHAARFTPRLFSPFEDEQLLILGYGITNLVDRATSTAAELDPTEFLEGAKRLEAKILQYSPEFIAFLGITAYRSAFERHEAIVGLQSERIGLAKIWVLPNPSGLNAHYQREDLRTLFGDLRQVSENETTGTKC